TLGVAVDLEHPEALLQRVIGQQAAYERVAQVQEQLDGLHGLDGPDYPRQNAQHTRLGAGRSQLGGRRLGDHAAVAGPDLRSEHGGLALESEDRAVDHGDALQERRVVHEIARREVVGAIHDDAVTVDDVEDVVGAQPD